MRRVLRILGALLAVSACGSPPIYPPTGVASCVAFCGAAADLDCPEGGTSPNGVSCVDVCERYHAAGYLRPYSECGAVATTVEQMRACGVACEE